MRNAAASSEPVLLIGRMQVFECAFTGYRSLRRIRFPLRRLNVFVGDNGVGKTNLYRALQLLQAAAVGTLGREIATEGGMESASWAGERRKHEKPKIELEVTIGAFPGARLVVPEPERTASFGMIYEEFPRRVFDAAELSDGTLRFLALAGALLGYRLPPFLALNEPETSLHPDHLAALARSQVWIVTHSRELATALEKAAGVRPLTVIKREGETWIEGLTIAAELK
jgi:predicted ATPase